MELFFLGTGSGVPSKHRNVSSLVLQLLQERGTNWLFDCGEATQHQILHTTIKPRKIEKIFITHLHGDHIFGLPGLLGSRSFQGGTTPIEIYGPPGLKEFVQTSLKVSQTKLKYEIRFHEITEGFLFEDEQFKVMVKKLEHGVASYAYRIEEKNKIGELLPDKLLTAGVKPGPIFQKIKENASVQLPDGRTIYREDFVGPPKKGKTICIFGDTRFSPQFAEFAKNSDILVHEATFGPADEDLAYEYFHSSTRQAASLAAMAKVKRLLLNHISSRYLAKDIPQLLEGAKEIFPNTQIVNDFDQVTV
ncbi:ribonuclease Z [Salinibacillus xinjiangensis]|uniref:Ribonuclease Z n=1 Tax=Salinibacillus xinjiangensis TaxID=1229268 RepID=A0A6G1X6R3_9BACI|nr:ribonuclease Z [Salinibacillus xinjiangensis]MRG86498.1 ribonuclease Z [Salinibacillus xinjiangensis]